MPAGTRVTEGCWDDVYLWYRSFSFLNWFNKIWSTAAAGITFGLFAACNIVLLECYCSGSPPFWRSALEDLMIRDLYYKPVKPVLSQKWMLQVPSTSYNPIKSCILTNSLISYIQSYISALELPQHVMVNLQWLNESMLTFLRQSFPW